MDIHKQAEEMGISPESFKKLCKTFLKTVDSSVESLSSAIEAGDCSEIAHSAHHIKGAAINLNFMNISSVAQHIEEEAKLGNSEALSWDLDRLKTEISTIRQEIHENL
jgi:HPt (histidine-containing phosphotransfer) domain-containing protein